MFFQFFSENVLVCNSYNLKFLAFRCQTKFSTRTILLPSPTLISPLTNTTFHLPHPKPSCSVIYRASKLMTLMELSINGEYAPSIWIIGSVLTVKGPIKNNSLPSRWKTEMLSHHLPLTMLRKYFKSFGKAIPPKEGTKFKKEPIKSVKRPK